MYVFILYCHNWSLAWQVGNCWEREYLCSLQSVETRVRGNAEHLPRSVVCRTQTRVRRRQHFKEYPKPQ